MANQFLSPDHLVSVLRFPLLARAIRVQLLLIGFDDTDFILIGRDAVHEPRGLAKDGACGAEQTELFLRELAHCERTMMEKQI